jgi:hypothetical protein
MPCVPWGFFFRFVVVFLTARDYERAYEGTRLWLDSRHFEYDDLVVVDSALDKIPYITRLCAGDAVQCTVIDDFTKNNHQAVPDIRADVVQQLQALPNVAVEVFDRTANNWAAILPDLLAKTNAPAWADFRKCTTHGCQESGMPPSVVVVSRAGGYAPTAMKRFATCLHNARVGPGHFQDVSEWDMVWLVKQNPPCLNVGMCAGF